MKKASEYRRHAQDCRELAVKMESSEQREQLLSMAQHWEQLAADRASLVRKHPELAQPGEVEEETEQPRTSSPRRA